MRLSVLQHNQLQRFMNFSARSLILILLQNKTILFMIGNIIAFLMKIISYLNWMILSRRSYSCENKHLYGTILCSQDPWAINLVLHNRWRALSGMEYCPCEALRSTAATFYSSYSYEQQIIEYW